MWIYNFKSSSADNRRTGYKAQAVQKMAPEFVRKGEDGFLQIYYDAFIPWITEAIKALYGQISGVEDTQVSQGREIASVKAEVAELEVEAAQLKVSAAAKDKKIRELEQRLEMIERALNSR